MIEYILWFISFVSLFVSLVWFSTFYLNRAEIPSAKKAGRLPRVTIAVPAYNEKDTIARMLKSLISLDYPKDKLEILVVEDGSKDGTYDVASRFIKKSGAKNIILLSQKNSGKASALNHALGKASGELFACVDADSTVSRDSLKKIVPHFADRKVGAVVSTIRVRQEKNFLQKLQRFEYIISSFFRRLFTSMEALYVTTGVLSVYRRKVVIDVGGFDENNITEDLEMGLRLNYNKYRVLVELGSRTYTEVPATIKAFWRQRIRWLRGHVYNMLKYRKMLFNSEYGFIGMFQLPLQFFSPVLMLLSAGIVTYGIIDRLYWLLLKLSVAPYSVFVIELPTIRQMIMTMKLPIIFPLFIIIAIGIYLYNQAHKYLKENWAFPFTFIIFLAIYPTVISYVWVAAIAQELLGAKRKW